MEERYTFSSILTKIIELEEKIREFYSQASKSISDDVTSLFKKYVEESSDRINRIMWARQRSVLEMTLEYISNVPLRQILSEINKIIKDKRINIIRKAIKIEKKIVELYKIISEKVYFMSMDISFLLDEFSKNSEMRIKELLNFL